MRLRKPCEHGVYDAHRSSEVFPYRHCPGGEFLPEDALVIEKVEGGWPKWPKTVVHDWFYSDASKGDHPATALLDALADQVGEPG